jgi:gamma-glutamylcyclotransferase (GGCT)/AIG2-like uncharacterized protein YtfP
MKIFTYGTLMDPEIMYQVCGRKYLAGKATLKDYMRKTLTGEVYPGITERRGCSVDGIVYFDVTAESIKRLDIFEGSFYQRTEVVVACDDGRKLPSQTYVITAQSLHRLSNDDWSFENFLANQKPLFQGGYFGYDELK